MGAGAAIGGAAGALIGGSAGASGAQLSANDLQQRYDASYTQCMYAHGDSVQSPPGGYQRGRPRSLPVLWAGLHWRPNGGRWHWLGVGLGRGWRWHTAIGTADSLATRIVAPGVPAPSALRARKPDPMAARLSRDGHRQGNRALVI